jgi:hypothetical protein
MSAVAVSQPLRDTSVVRARSASAPAETVRSIPTLCSGPFGSGRTCLGSLDCLTLLVDVRPIVRALRLGLVRGLGGLSRCGTTLLRCRLSDEQLKAEQGGQQCDRKPASHFHLLCR